jgi:transcriptional regulator NrdR family protein
MNHCNLTHFKCPNCGSYVRAPVKETRNEFGGVFRRRRCEQCKIIIETLEQITGFHKVGYKINMD